MKSPLATIIILGIAAFASPAAAYVVEVSTSILVTNVADEAPLEHALESAIDDVLNRAIAFARTAATVQNARVVGDRIYDGAVALRVLTGVGDLCRRCVGVHWCRPTAVMLFSPLPM